jgi:uncharacterized sporulation protein YeaH/YhbH (DUF444 family)
MPADDMYIIDRRLNPSGKSLANRQRFLRRAKALARGAVRDDSKDRNIGEIDQGGEVLIPVGGVREPKLRRSATGGVREYVVPGNKEFLEGDEIPKPERGRPEGSPDSDDEDEFRFVLSADEYLDLFLEDLELPDLHKRRLATTSSISWRRAGYSVTGAPANLALARTLRNSLSRRIAMRRPKVEEIRRLEQAIKTLERNGADSEELMRRREELAQLVQRSRRIPYIDPLDLRYRQFQPQPNPVAQAVMFCLMDVSGSMTEHMKDLAKRFFALLYVFLKRRYQHVDIVFIRHTHEASEVDEQTFFYSTATGGTVVSTAFQEMARIAEVRYSSNDWNIYAAQASDGDNTSSDNQTTATLLKHAILPLCQYFAYLEVAEEEHQADFVPHRSNLWRTYESLQGEDVRFAMREVRQRGDIYPVFRELFQRQPEAKRSAEW